MTNDQERVNTSKFNIRQALGSVGVDVPVDTPLDEYPPYIMGLSGGGGSGLPEITTETVEVLASGLIPFAEQNGMYQGIAAADFSYAEGETYIITWDNTPYTCTAYSLMRANVVGNASILGAGEDTGEPFFSLTRNNTILFFTAETAATHDCAVEGLEQSPPDGTALVVVNGEWKQQSGYAYEDDGNVTPFNPDFFPTSMYAFEYTTTAEEGINANKHGNYIITTSAFEGFTESNKTYPVVIYGINLNPSSGIADFDFAVPYAFYRNHKICVGINNVKDTPLIIPSGSKINGVLLIPKVIQLT